MVNFFGEKSVVCAWGLFRREREGQKTLCAKKAPLTCYIMADENDDHNRATLSTKTVLSTLKIRNDRCGCPTEIRLGVGDNGV